MGVSHQRVNVAHGQLTIEFEALLSCAKKEHPDQSGLDLEEHADRRQGRTWQIHRESSHGRSDTERGKYSRKRSKAPEPRPTSGRMILECGPKRRSELLRVAVH